MNKKVFGKDVHTFLSEKAREKIEGMGYRILSEFEIENKGKKYRVDLVAKKNNEQIAIECLVEPNPNIIRKKVKEYSHHFSKIVFAIPENTLGNFPNLPCTEFWKFKVPEKLWGAYGKRIIVDLTDQQFTELEKMIEAGIYTTKTEAIRDAVRKLIEEKRKTSLIRNGGEYECF